MAWLNIKEAEVVNVFYNGLGAKLKETFTKGNGEQGASYYSAFADTPHGLNIGDTVKASGAHGAKATEHEGKWRAEVTLNKATFEVLTYASDAEPPAPF